MTEIETRLTGNYPALQMTMISLIVALVYEKVIESVQAQEQLWIATPENFLLWSQFFSIAIWPLEYWFTMSLSSSSVRTVFRPRDALGPLAPALAFFVLASNVGGWNPALWLYAGSALFCLAWVALREQGVKYAFDPMLAGDARTHSGSRWMMLAFGVVMLAGGIGLHLNAIGPLVAGTLLLISLAGSIVAHAVWYGEWQKAVNLQATNLSGGV